MLLRRWRTAGAARPIRTSLARAGICCPAVALDERRARRVSRRQHACLGRVRCDRIRSWCVRGGDRRALSDARPGSRVAGRGVRECLGEPWLARRLVSEGDPSVGVGTAFSVVGNDRVEDGNAVHRGFANVGLHLRGEPRMASRGRTVSQRRPSREISRNSSALSAMGAGDRPRPALRPEALYVRGLREAGPADERSVAGIARAGRALAD